MTAALRLSEHAADCPAKGNAEATCACLREVGKWAPELPRAVAVRRWGESGVAAMVRAGVLERTRHGRFYLSRLFGL